MIRTNYTKTTGLLVLWTVRLAGERMGQGEDPVNSTALAYPKWLNSFLSLTHKDTSHSARLYNVGQVPFS
jgi:hypothetical protein